MISIDFIIALILIALGVTIMRYRYQIYDMTGEWSWASTYLGGNGTVVAISLIGMILIAMGVAYPFGLKEQLSATPKIQVQQQN